MERDPVDLFIEQWNRERPELDPSALGVVGRVLMLEKHLEQSADRALDRFGVCLWQFDVLAALRRSGPPFKLSPTRLMQLVTLTSGAMTNRIDRLEVAGLVVREADPCDRRGVQIALTREGKKLVDEAIAVRLDDARRNIAVLSRAEQRTLAALLRRVLIANAGAIQQTARCSKRPLSA
ncbi:MAG: MarR family transcriptional regulator [Microbacteriaceae bacterium]|nr:MarR family transcriptional regulator [Microbacteriaceae bacterium]